MSSVLLLGCGHSKAVRKPTEGVDYSAPSTLDIDPSANPDIIWDLNNLPYPFDNNEFDEVHAYEVLEHCGTQGDWRFFFNQFNELWRILKPNGLLIFSVPTWTSPWAWGDPGHTRIIHPASITFLHQQNYVDQVGKNSMTDYRGVYKGDFDLVDAFIENDSFVCTLRGLK